MKDDITYVVAMNGQDLLAVIPRGKSVKASILSEAHKAGITDYSEIQIFFNCELKDEAFEGDLIVYRSRSKNDLVDVHGNPRLYAILSE